MHKFKREIKGILGKLNSMNSWYKKGKSLKDWKGIGTESIKQSLSVLVKFY